MLASADLDAIAAQMGRAPRGVVSVAVRCPAGHPAVVVTYPLRRRGDRLSPFPTLFWLTCPRLARRISHLEQHGQISLIEAQLARDPALRDALLRDHERYIAQRWETLTPDDRALVSARGLHDEFHARGIGGLLSRTSIKCLHLHFAHHLASGNAVGRLLAERFDLHPCPADP
ncbi:MAG: DUF501 domain-containing protein [Planctomycetota bacterium]|nr:DUF501 domain-containing protein [Planctomycetota bacterium]